MGEPTNSTAPSMSATGTHHHHDAEDCIEKNLPDLYPVYFHSKTFFGATIKSKEMDESSERTNDGNIAIDGASVASANVSHSWASFFPLLWNSMLTCIYLLQSFVVTNCLQTSFNTNTWEDVKIFRSVMSMEGGGSASASASATTTFH